MFVRERRGIVSERCCSVDVARKMVAEEYAMLQVVTRMCGDAGLRIRGRCVREVAAMGSLKGSRWQLCEACE